MAWEWPQWVVLGILITRVFLVLLVHDMPRTGRFNASETALGVLVWIIILGYGGFWK